MSKSPRDRILRIILVGVVFACCAIAYLWYAEFKKDQDEAAFARSYVGRPFGDLVAQIGEPGVSWRSEADIARNFGNAPPESTVHVFSGKHSLVCVLVDEAGVIRRVKQRGSP